MIGYPGCRQTEATVVVRGLLWDQRLIALGNLRGSWSRLSYKSYNHNQADVITKHLWGSHWWPSKGMKISMTTQL